MYCTLDDLKTHLTEKTLAQLTSDQIPPVLDDAAVSVVNEMAASAADFIHGFLTDRYTIPLPAPVPGLIKEISITLTAWKLYNRKFGAEMPEGMITERKTAINLLEHLQQNKLALYPAGRDVVTMRVSKKPSDRIFPRDVLDQM